MAEARLVGLAAGLARVVAVTITLVVSAACVLRAQQADSTENWSRTASLAQLAVPVQGSCTAAGDFGALDAVRRAIGSPRVVMLGEQSHGHAPAFEVRVRLVRFLHEEVDFDVLAFGPGFYGVAKAWSLIEGGMPDGVAAERAFFQLWSRPEQFGDLFDYIVAEAEAGTPLQLAGFDNQASGTLSRDSLTNDLGDFFSRVGGFRVGGKWPDFVWETRTLAGQAFLPGSASADSVRRSWDSPARSLAGLMRWRRDAKARPSGHSSFAGPR